MYYRICIQFSVISLLVFNENWIKDQYSTNNKVIERSVFTITELRPSTALMFPFLFVLYVHQLYGCPAKRFIVSFFFTYLSITCVYKDRVNESHV